MSDEKTYPGTWEMVDSSGASIRQFRQRVVGGWLVVCTVDEQSTSLFVPDPNGEWDPPIKQGRKKSDGFF